jgi:hypothetical protein
LHVLLAASGMLKKRVSTSIEVGKIAREKDDSRGIAISPLDSYGLAIRQHCRRARNYLTRGGRASNSIER